MSQKSDRRSFLTQLLAGGTVAWLVGKEVFGQSIMGDYANPVSFIKQPDELDRSFFEVDQNLGSEDVFPLSVASGDPRVNGIVLWTTINSSSAVNETVAFQMARNSNFSQNSIVVEGLVQTNAGRDFTVKLPVQNAALRPFTTYYYRFIYNNTASRTGRFKTLPTDRAFISSLRFAFISCQDYANGFYTALQFLAQENLDFVVHLGDYIYETASSGVRSIPPLPSGAATAQTLDDYRHIYRTYRSDRNLQAVHENFTVISIWDDHEFANDSWREFHPDDNITPDTPRPEQRQAANQAWSEYNLADVPFDPNLPPTESITAYRSFVFGNLLELVVTDERLYRDGPPCGFEQFGQRYFSQRCGAAESPARTMLGQTQRDWFIEQMTNSRAVWKFWANEVMLMQFKILNSFASLASREAQEKMPEETKEKIAELQSRGLFDIFATLDQWDGYPAERAAILETLEENNVRNLVAITGDIHSFLAGYLKKNYDDLFESPVGIELVVGSVTSANFAELIEGALQGIPIPNGPVTAENILEFVELLGTVVIRLNNPHMAYFDSSNHGYSIVEVNQFSITCTMKAVSTVRSQTTALRTLKRFIVFSNSNLLLPY
jgi:alkaline phosphatase D